MLLSSKLSIAIISLIIGLIFGYSIGTTIEKRNSNIVIENMMESRRQTYLAELNTEEANRQEFYATLSAEKARKEVKAASKTNNSKPIIYSVTNLKTAQNWYQQAFKQELIGSTDSSISFDMGDEELRLQLVSTIKLSESSIIVHWEVNNIHQEFERFLKLGAVAKQKPKELVEGIATAKVIDPWGNIIELIHYL